MRALASLALSLLLTSATACASEPTTNSPTPASPSAGGETTASKPASPASDSAGQRTLETGERGTRPKNSNPAPTSLGSPAPGLTPIAVVLVEGKAVILSEGRRATLRMDPSSTWWDGKDLRLAHHGGMRIYGQGDATWWQAGEVPANLANLGGLLQASGQLGTWVEVETLKSGQQRVWANVSGKRQRLGIFKEAPVASIYLLSPAPKAEGTESTRLGKASGFAFDAQGQPQRTIPTGATAIAPKAPPAADLDQWKADLGKLRGADVTPTWSAAVDLDRDGKDEGAICVTGGKDDTDCYVVDLREGALRYYGLSSMKLAAGAPAPLAFSYREGVYLMHVAGTAERASLAVARYDGVRFVAEGVR